jgi:tetrahydromethanopterin S-methyltransferase subunit G
MKLVLTLLVRDEEDIVDAQLAFHLNAGVDFVIATDNRSQDGTTAILERYEREGRLHLIREPADDFRESEWVSRMARLAATEFGADWVINASADEFWWPRARSLKEALAAVPDRYDAARGLVRHFPPRPDDGSFFAERLTVRLAPQAPLVDPGSPFAPYGKVAFRPHAGVVVSRGSHELHSPAVVLRGWYPVEVLHFPVRMAEQLGRKGTAFTTSFAKSPRGYGTAYHERAHRAQSTGQLAAHFEELVVDDEALARGLADGTLVEDVRVRDALRALREGAGLALAPPTVVDDAAFAVDATVLDEADAVRLHRRLDQIERRLAVLERRPARRVQRRVARLVRSLGQRR